jgi:hypothetical protein
MSKWKKDLEAALITAVCARSGEWVDETESDTVSVPEAEQEVLEMVRHFFGAGRPADYLRRCIDHKLGGRYFILF